MVLPSGLLHRVTTADNFKVSAATRMDFTGRPTSDEDSVTGIVEVARCSAAHRIIAAMKVPRRLQEIASKIITVIDYCNWVVN